MRILWVLPLVAALLPLAGCASTRIGGDAEIRTVAVASLAVSNWRGASITELALGHDPEDLRRVVQTGMNDLLRISEAELGKRWQVVPAREFIIETAYRRLAADARHRIFTPALADTPMPVFTTQIRDILKGDIPPEKARDLCAAIGVDAVVIIFSDWGTRGGGLSPTVEAVTKNVLAIWDAHGRKRFSRRLDQVGTSAVGRHLYYEVSEKTIGVWTGAFGTALAEIVEAI